MRHLDIGMGDDKRYLLHNNNFRYQNNLALPISNETTILSSKDYLFPEGTISSRNLELFRFNVKANEEHALNWMRRSRGISCKRAGGYIAEYNARYSPVTGRENFEDLFVRVLHDQYLNQF